MVKSNFYKVVLVAFLISLAGAVPFKLAAQSPYDSVASLLALVIIQYSESNQMHIVYFLTMAVSIFVPQLQPVASGLSALVWIPFVQ